MRVSVIATVYNEASVIERLLDSLANQTRPPDEVVICDGGSRDGTVEVIRRYVQQYPDRLPGLQVLVQPGANISQGRNQAIAAAAGPIIAATDAGVRLTPTWLEKLVVPWITEHASPLAVAGFFLPDIDTLFTTAMAATVLPLLDEIQPQRFLPSSRSVAFTKAAWQNVGGYPEWLDYCEDLLFDFALNAQQPTLPTAFAWAPEAVVYFRPRESLGAFWTQYYRYARGDGKADLWRKRHLIRYATYWVAWPLLLGYAIGGPVAPWLGWLGWLGGMGIYCQRPWLRLRQLGSTLSWPQWWLAALLVPVIRVVGDGAKMVGYPVGLWWRWRNRHRQEIKWRKGQ